MKIYRLSQFANLETEAFIPYPFQILLDTRLRFPVPLSLPLILAFNLRFLILSQSFRTLLIIDTDLRGGFFRDTLGLWRFFNQTVSLVVELGKSRILQVQFVRKLSLELWGCFRVFLYSQNLLKSVFLRLDSFLDRWEVFDNHHFI